MAMETESGRTTKRAAFDADSEALGRNGRSGQSFIQDLNAFVSEAGVIVRDVIDLGALRLGMMRTEMRESAKTARRSAVALSIAGALAALALITLTICLTCAIASVLPFSPFSSVACAALLVTIVYGVAAWIAWRAAMKSMNAVRLAPHETLSELRKDLDIVTAVRAK